MSRFIIMQTVYREEYYIGQEVIFYGTSDGVIAELIHMSKKEYQKILMEQFNGFRERGEVYFNKKEDCENALNWLEEQYLIYYLAES